MRHVQGFVAAALAERTVDRRGFLTLAGKGLAIAFTMPLVGRVAAVRAADGPTGEELANAYIHIGTDGSITLSFGGAEMGQGSKSGLAQILAEELGVDWPQVTLVRQELVDPVVSYFTGGSSAVAGPQPSSAEGVDRAPGPAMRLLPVRNDHGRHRAPEDHS